MKDKVGIYCLLNKKDGKKYVGSSKDLESRLLTHLTQLENNIHSNKRLQEAFNNDGLAFTILEELPRNASKEEILNCEQKWINMYQSTNTSFGYNKINSAQDTYTAFSRKELRSRKKRVLNVLGAIAQCNPYLNKMWRIVKAIIQ